MAQQLLTVEQLQRHQIRTLQQQLYDARAQAAKWENDATQYRAELTFLTSQNDNLVLKLQTARRQLDHCERTYGIKITTIPETAIPNITPVPL